MVRKNNLGKFITELRIKKSYSQQDLAKMLDMNISVILKAESGNYIHDGIEKICLMLDKLSYDSKNFRVLLC